MSELCYDVAVVGDGIAGSAAVIALAQAGISVVWMCPDANKNGSSSKGNSSSRHKVGESLAPAANTILHSLGLSYLLDYDCHRSANATFSSWGQDALVERNAAVHLEGAGHIIDRVKFEGDLHDMAKQASDFFLIDSLSSMQEEEAIWILTTQGGCKVNARFIIDATGRSQAVGKMLARSNKTHNHTDDHLVAAYSFLQQKNNNDVDPTPATLIESVENGWWYASLLSSGLLSLNFYSDPDLLPRGLTANLDLWLALISQTKHVSYWIEDAGFDVVKPPEITSAATRWLTPVAGINHLAGWAAIGDAAVAFDPLSAHGMTTALWSAVQMPDVVTEYFAEPVMKGAERLNQYSNAVEEGRTQYLNQRRVIYGQEKRFQAGDFWIRRNI
ncbi:glycine oxidase maturase GoxB [Marinomonas algicola]|uniref:glycine oxidase maturase GoxB n=1 Tax=Marinomonas algicola TaxID=2773454 RepID=UPI00174B21F5|nr:glycine oxidase maturase GoxB [Marinomonas algicola]